jgi:hypothetical protein
MPWITGPRLSRAFAVLAAGAVTALAGAFVATPAFASPSVTVTWNVDAQTHLAKLGSDVNVPRGSFSGTIDLATGDLVGNLSLPPAQITLYLGGAAAAADASFAIAPVGPTTGHVDLATKQVQTSSTFDIRLTKVTPHSPLAAVNAVNLVGPNCRTSKPITVSMGGTVDFVHGGTFSGTYAIPKFQHCEAMTAAINAVIPGGGNTFAATFSPPGTPPPPAPPGPAPAPFGFGAQAAVPPTAVAAPVAHATVNATGKLPVDAPPNAGLPLGLGFGGVSATGQAPVTPPKPPPPTAGGLLGLVLGTG